MTSQKGNEFSKQINTRMMPTNHAIYIDLPFILWIKVIFAIKASFFQGLLRTSIDGNWGVSSFPDHQIQLWTPKLLAILAHTIFSSCRSPRPSMVYNHLWPHHFYFIDSLLHSPFFLNPSLFCCSTLRYEFAKRVWITSQEECFHFGHQALVPLYVLSFWSGRNNFVEHIQRNMFAHVNCGLSRESITTSLMHY